MAGVGRSRAQKVDMRSTPSHVAVIVIVLCLAVSGCARESDQESTQAVSPSFTRSDTWDGLPVVLLDDSTRLSLEARIRDARSRRAREMQPSAVWVHLIDVRRLRTRRVVPEYAATVSFWESTGTGGGHFSVSQGSEHWPLVCSADGTWDLKPPAPPPPPFQYRPVPPLPTKSAARAAIIRFCKSEAPELRID